MWSKCEHTSILQAKMYVQELQMGKRGLRIVRVVPISFERIERPWQRGILHVGDGNKAIGNLLIHQE